MTDSLWAYNLTYDVDVLRWSDFWEGPFDTRAEAEKACREAMEDGLCRGRVAPCFYPKPEEYIRVNLSGLLEDLDTDAQDDGCYAEDEPLFQLADELKAEEALTALLREWAKEYVMATAFTVEIEKGEEI